MKILFLTARFPWPLLTGDRVRAYHQVRLLSARHRVTLLSFVDEAFDPRSRSRLEPFCERLLTVPLSRTRMARGVLRQALSRIPLQTALFDVPAMREVIRRLMAESAFDVAHVQLARMTACLDELTSVPRVIDLIDALSVNMNRQFGAGWGPLRWAAYVEGIRMRHHERLVCDTVDQATVVSAADRLAIGPYENLSVNPNGVDLEAFPFSAAPRQPGSVVLSGNLGYFPNVSAGRWFVRDVLPRIRADVPNVNFHLVGARPDRRLRALAREHPWVTVEGPVDHMHPHLARHQVAVAPMLAGSGQVLKVLEAMATGTPVVTTPLGLNGIDAEDGRHVLVAESAPRFAEHVTALLRDPERAAQLAREARRLVEDRYTWDRSIAQLEAIYETVCARARRTAGGEPVTTAP